MEHGFFHPNRGYWQTISEPSPEILAGYPPGTMPVPVRPSENHHWDGEQWIEMLADVEELKARKNAAITARRVQEDQRFQFGGKWFQADQAAWKQISGVHGWVAAQNAMPPGWIGQWKSEDNTLLPIPDPATWWQFYGAVLARGSSNFMRGEALKAQLAAATTAEEVAAVPDW